MKLSFMVPNLDSIDLGVNFKNLHQSGNYPMTTRVSRQATLGVLELQQQVWSTIKLYVVKLSHHVQLNYQIMCKIRAAGVAKLSNFV